MSHCNECGELYTNKCNCNIIGKGSAEVSTNGNDITVTVPHVTVTSDDDSIIVNREVDGNTINYNISKECCPDQFVKACMDDTTPGTLTEKINVDTSGPLTYNLRDCPGDAYIEIGFDTDFFKNENNKVAVDDSCTGKFLGEVLKSGDPYFQFNTVPGCEYQLQTQPRQLFRAELYSENEGSSTVVEETGFVSLRSMHVNVTSSHTGNVQDATITGLSGTVKAVTIPRTGWYQINMQGSYVVDGMHTVRTQICKYVGGNLPPILDHRMEASWRLADGDIETQNELNEDISGPVHSGVISSGGREMNMSHFLRGYGYSGSTVTKLNAGEVLLFVAKYNAIEKNKFRQGNTSVSTLTFTGRNSVASTNGEGAGCGWSISELPENTLTN